MKLWPLVAASLLACALHGPGVAQESGTQAETVYDSSTPGLKPPHAIYSPDPNYSKKAAKKKIVGEVLLSLIVTSSGTVRDVEVTQSLEKSLDKKAVETVRTWRFDPATLDGKPVAVRIRVQITFRIY